MAWKSTIGVTVLAYLFYRRQDIYFQLVPPNLPPQWFAYGDAPTACKIVTDRLTSTPHLSDVPEFRFCEDMVRWDLKASEDDDKASVDGRTRYLIVGCDPGRKEWNPVMGPLRDPWAIQGSLWLYPYTSGSSSSSSSVPRKLDLVGFPKTSTFHPFGIDVIYDAKRGTYRLFAINQGEGAPSVEVFDLAPPPPRTTTTTTTNTVKATHVKTLTHPGIVSPNSIAAISPTSFYVTNDHTLTRRIPYVGTVLHVAETFLKIFGGWVDLIEFADGENDAGVTVSRAIGVKIPFANGIALSPDGGTVAVASSTEMAIRFYKRDVSTHALTYDSRVVVPFHADNLAFEEEDSDPSRQHGGDGDGAGRWRLYASGTPFYPDLIKVVKGKKEVSASWVVEVSPRTKEDEMDLAPVPSHGRAPLDDKWVVKTVYQSDGSGFSASATGLVDREGGKVFVSGVYEARGILQWDWEYHYCG
ncbi:hypothetical protein FRB90_005466 [Tulasnella sp. 427]|nr:hypothetical protein FRB90_005466 [Tulasnella sp. 427]